MISIFIRTGIIYAVLTVVLRLMGKRQVGELEVSDLIPTLLLSEIAALPIDDTDIPLAHALIPMAFLFGVEIIVTFAKTKWNPLKKVFEGKPIFLIEKGKINQTALGESRISIDELLGECRIQGIGDICEVYYGILEQDGKISLLKRKPPNETETGMAHPLILDGTIQEKAGEKLGLDMEAICHLAKERGYSPKDIFILQQDDLGKTVCIPKERKDR